MSGAFNGCGITLRDFMLGQPGARCKVYRKGWWVRTEDPNRWRSEESGAVRWSTELHHFGVQQFEAAQVTAEAGNG
jgi:hypothetical protein